ncbi:hypothetical protein G7085_16725 [Tessaracoccus sp. HDW20]|uniref:SIS domain-containing protein n=1 Tax=Tessaracoccus coleopterorum TaxID=2714950 RepID=UPI0018D433BB|nr:SIS domain-containing protein [Tessaracoccus coleopterorum]NHB85689.1 hypothetical protein [Tessaracoccus coleopterorum]
MPVPFMAWPGPTLPAWVGPLDMVVVLGGYNSPEWVLHCAGEAARRGVALIVTAPEDSALAAAAASGGTTLIPTFEDDPVAAAVAALALLGDLGLGPIVHPEHVADAADLVAEACAPRLDLAANPGKELALELADGIPLVWGGTVLAGRASRRIAEALRRASGRPALAADASELDTLLGAVPVRDPFADPFDDAGDSRPVVVLLDDDKVPAPTVTPPPRSWSGPRPSASGSPGSPRAMPNCGPPTWSATSRCSSAAATGPRTWRSGSDGTSTYAGWQTDHP